MGVPLDGVLQVIFAAERSFHDGARWTKFTQRDYFGNRCIQGALSSVRASDGTTTWHPWEEIAAASYFIETAILESGSQGSQWRFGIGVIESFNDAPQHSYREIAAVLARARELAAASYHAQQRAAPLAEPVIDLTPPAWPALPAPEPSLFGGLFAGPSPVAAPVANRPRIAGNDPWATPAPWRRPR